MVRSMWWTGSNFGGKTVEDAKQISQTTFASGELFGYEKTLFAHQSQNRRGKTKTPVEVESTSCDTSYPWSLSNRPRLGTFQNKRRWKSQTSNPLRMPFPVRRRSRGATDSKHVPSCKLLWWIITRTPVRFWEPQKAVQNPREICTSLLSVVSSTKFTKVTVLT